MGSGIAAVAQIVRQRNRSGRYIRSTVYSFPATIQRDARLATNLQSGLIYYFPIAFMKSALVRRRRVMDIDVAVIVQFQSVENWRQGFDVIVRRFALIE